MIKRVGRFVESAGWALIIAAVLWVCFGWWLWLVATAMRAQP